MIVVTRLNDSQFAINPDLIERIHETPDTTIVMVDGAKYIVTETMAEVIDLIARYRSRIVALAYGDEPAAPRPDGRTPAAKRSHDKRPLDQRPLELVPPAPFARREL
jgi:flagellar protein FlbD